MALFHQIDKWINKNLHFCLDNENDTKQKQSAQPIFKASIVLSIPNFAMMPALDEIQQMLNKAVDRIVSVMKGVGQWSKERLSKVRACVFSTGLVIFCI